MKVTRFWWVDENGKVIGPAPDNLKPRSQTLCLQCDVSGRVRFLAGYLFCDECFERSLRRMR